MRINNREMTEELKEFRGVKNQDCDKFKNDKRRLLKKCKALEATVKTQTKDIETLKKKLESKSKQVKTYEQEIEAFKAKILQFNHDIDEFKKTNAVLSEAQRKNVDIENRQQALKIIRLQNYIKELHNNINRCQKIDLKPEMIKESFCTKTDYSITQRSQSCGHQPLQERVIDNDKNGSGILYGRIPRYGEETDESKSSNGHPSEDLLKKIYNKYKDCR